MSHGRACRLAHGGAGIAAALVVIVGLAGCGASSPSSSNGARASETLRRHSAATSAPAAGSTPSTSTAGMSRSDPRRPEEKEQSAAPGSPSAARLGVARRFSDAYMAYQIARLTPDVAQTIRQTCTPAFARFLLAHPVVLPPALVAHPADLELFRVASVNPGAGDRVSVSYVSEQLRSDTGSFLLSLTFRAGRWLISRLDA